MSGEKNYLCGDCNRKFSDMEALNRHRKMVHEQPKRESLSEVNTPSPMRNQNEKV